jgi:hypothetical protein
MRRATVAVWKQADYRRFGSGECRKNRIAWHQRMVVEVVVVVDEEMRRIDSDWYDEVLVLAFGSVCESQIQRAEEGMMGYWNRRGEFGRKSYLSNADSPGLGAGCHVLDHKKWD